MTPRSAFLVLSPILAAALASCSDSDAPSAGRGGSEAGSAGSKLALLETDGWGTVRGRVTLEGEPPPRPPIDVTAHPDAAHCAGDRLVDNTWVVDPATKGVANAVVWLEPPAGTEFPRQPEGMRTWPEEVVIDQPHCLFEPRVVVVYPEYFNFEKGKSFPTGQRLIIRNSADIRHQATLIGGNTANPEQGHMIAPGGEVSLKLEPDRVPVRLSCTLHRWMEGHVWAFDHPHAAVTDVEGHFEIRNAPAGAEVSLRAWHEAGTFELPRGGRPVTIPADAELTVDLSLRFR